MTTQTTQAHPKQHTAKTTTLVIERPQNYALLEERFRLVRYLIPKALRSQNAADFGRVHNAIRDQIKFPYRSFQYDTLDGALNKQWAVYVLYPREAEVSELVLTWYQPRTPLPRREIAFSDLPLHVLLKLLQFRLFRGDKTNRFVGQDKCYVYARPGGKDSDFHYCVEIELSGAPANSEDAPTQEFRVIPHARCFGKVTPPLRPGTPFFGKRAVGSRFVLLHLTTAAVEQESPVYSLVTFPGKRVQIKYHDLRDVNAGRGKIVFDFTQQFIVSLREVGIVAHLRERNFTLAPLSKTADIAVQQLTEVGIYDNRLRRTHSLDAYLDLFQGMYPALRFAALDDIASAPQGGVIVLLDAAAEDFEEDGLLFGRDDPYPPLYREHPNVPKQSINVNTNDPDALEGGDYLDYSMLQLSDKDFKRNLDVVLSELYLKCAIIHGTARYPLPFIPDELAFVRRRPFDGDTITTALWFAEQQLHFIDLGDPAQSEPFYEMLEGWGVDWDKQYEKLLAERKRISEQGQVKDLPEFDIIVGRDLFVAIENLKERIFYDYDAIEQRHQEQYSTAYPVKYFQLAPHYERIQQERSTTLLPLEQMMQQGLLDGSKQPSTRKARDSQAFYRQLLAYDAFLEEVAATHPMLTYQELTSGEWLERIARIFDSKATSQGKYHRRLITRIYNDLGMFLPERGENVQLYQGIWYDDTDAFLVGSPTSMNLQGQARAHLVRRFQIMQGSSHFDKEELLKTMGVLFVRHKQYTVSPYYFHLIDLYVENVLRYGSSGEEDS
ncbi:MAG TPA: hypothetical protein VFA09_19870 [Ktedonobacteraceae bacterium]|nr:hypothetical protein [Ktedonobacteraceae bacterium]HZU69541.1 hypothetical protein [Ktedonobacteraceae bacterium]